MIKLSLNSSEAAKAQIAPQVPFASTLAAAVEAAGAVPAPVKSASVPAKKAAKRVPTPVPSNGLLSRGLQWLQNKGRSKKRMQMIETVSLGDKRFVALVKVDGREFLLGGAPTSVGMLADLGAHGLGELLSVADLVSTTTAGAPPIAPAAGQAPLPALSSPSTAAALPVAPERTREELSEAMAFELPIAVVATAPVSAAAPPAKLNVTVEADEDESDWLLEDELDVKLKSAVEVKPSADVAQIPQETVAAPAPAAKLAPKVEKQIEIAEVLGPKAVPATAPRLDLNFTFQMWGTPQPPAPVPPTALHPGPVAVAPLAKAKTPVDLENCPELLGEPYVLALVDTSHGAAA